MGGGRGELEYVMYTNQLFMVGIIITQHKNKLRKTNFEECEHYVLDTHVLIH